MTRRKIYIKKPKASVDIRCLILMFDILLPNHVSENVRENYVIRSLNFCKLFRFGLSRSSAEKSKLSSQVQNEHRIERKQSVETSTFYSEAS